VVITYARRRNAAKRGGGNVQTTLDADHHIAIDQHAEWLLALDEALRRLKAWNPRLARIVKCRFFAGLSEDETATALSVSLRTAQRD
jgi:DNA-directed RNA polymerase specialized sigma24 family protein